MPLEDNLSLAGEAAASIGQGVSVEPPEIAKRYLSADTIGKLKACGVKWQIRYGTFVHPGATGIQVVGENLARVLLVVFDGLAVNNAMYPGSLDQANAGFNFGGANTLVFNYDTYGPLVGAAWTMGAGVGGNYNFIEVTALQ